MAGIIQDKIAPASPDEVDPNAPPVPATAPGTESMDGSQDPDESAEDPSEEASESPDQESAEDSQEPDAATGPNKITSASLEASMHLTPQQKQQLQRIVVAGMKVMFDPKTHQMMLDEIQKPGPIEQKLGMSIAGLLGLLVKESNNSLPPQLLIPAGIILLAHASEFLVHAGIPCSDHDIANSIDVFVHTVLTAFKLDPAKVQAIGGKALDPDGEDGDDATDAAPAAPSAPAAPGGGIIGGAMPPGAQ